MDSPSPSTSQDVPPVMRRGLYWSVALTVLLSIGAVAWVIVRGPLGVPRGWAYRYGRSFWV